jgi:hypothetical protein
MDAYAASIAGRTVAHTNTKPTANKFRQFSTPKVFDVLRKRRENERLLGQLGRRLSISHLSLSNSVGCTSTFITETLPHMRNIVPNGKQLEQEYDPSYLLSSMFNLANSVILLGSLHRCKSSGR